MVRSMYEEAPSAVQNFLGGTFFKVLCGLFALFVICSFTGCLGTSVRSGMVGVRVVDVAMPGAQAGVQPNELTTGWHPPIPGTYILTFPTTYRTEVWSDQEAQGIEPIGPALQFNNADGVPTKVALSVQISMDPNRASDAVQRYRLGFDDMIRGPVQRDLQGALIRLGVHYHSDQLLADGGAALVAEVTTALQNELRSDGIELHSMNLVTAPILPDAIRQRINARIEAEQNAATQEQQVRVVQAQAQQRIAEAEGLARATQIEGEALRANPQVLRQREIDRWNGLCPLDGQICAPGADVIANSNRN